MVRTLCLFLCPRAYSNWTVCPSSFMLKNGSTISSNSAKCSWGINSLQCFSSTSRCLHKSWSQNKKISLFMPIFTFYLSIYILYKSIWTYELGTCISKCILMNEKAKFQHLIIQACPYSICLNPFCLTQSWV
jgi:hypothetical protein